MRQVQSSFRRRRAKILLLSVFFLVVMLAFMALSVDVGYMYSVKARLQAVADAAACAGAIALADGEDQALPATVQFAELNRAYANEFTVQADDSQLGIWDDETATFTPMSEATGGSANAVRVFIRRTKDRGNEAGLFFAKIMGTDYADIVATATARYKNTKCGIIVGLSMVALNGDYGTDGYKSDDGPYFPGTSLDTGNVCSNGNIMLNQMASISGDAHPGENGTVMDNSTGDVSGSTASLAEPLSYPPVDMSEVSASNDNASVPLSNLGVNPVTPVGSFVLNGTQNVALPAGEYYFTSMSLSGGATITVSAETKIYVAGNVTMSGGSILNNTMKPQNLQIYANGPYFTMSGTADFYGVTYAPNSRFTLSGSANYYGAVICNILTAAGIGGGIHADDSLEVELLDVGVKRTALVE